MRGSWNLIEGEFAVRSLNVWQTAEDNGRDSCSQLKTHPANSHVSFEPDVTDVPQTHASKWWETKPVESSYTCSWHHWFVAFLLFSKLATSVTLLLAPLSLSSLDGSGAALAAAVFSSIKEAFIVASIHLRTKEALHRHDLRPFPCNAYNTFKVNAQTLIDGEDLDIVNLCMWLQTRART